MFHGVLPGCGVQPGGPSVFDTRPELCVHRATLRLVAGTIARVGATPTSVVLPRRQRPEDRDDAEGETGHAGYARSLIHTRTLPRDRFTANSLTGDGDEEQADQQAGR